MGKKTANRRGVECAAKGGLFSKELLLGGTVKGVTLLVRVKLALQQAQFEYQHGDNVALVPNKRCKIDFSWIVLVRA